MNRYQARTVRPLQRWDCGNWRMKVYAIVAPCRAPGDELLEAGKDEAARLLDTVAAGTAHHGIGFVGVHWGHGADVVFVDWWAAENELHHHLYVAEAGRPGTVRPREPGELTACVWDLEVLAFEREAWIRWVLYHPDSPRWEEYLSCLLERPG